MNRGLVTGGQKIYFPVLVMIWLEDFKKGKVEIKNDKLGNVHLSIGKVSFDEAKLADNFDEVIAVLTKAKPSSSKGEFIKNIHMSSTMGPSIIVDINN